MKSFKNTQELIAAFLDGEKEGFAGTNPVLSNTKICGDQIIHYSTPIVERNGSSFVLNVSKYSIQTSRLQKMLLEAMKDKTVVSINNVDMDYKGSLLSLLKSNQ